MSGGAKPRKPHPTKISSWFRFRIFHRGDAQIIFQSGNTSANSTFDAAKARQLAVWLLKYAAWAEHQKGKGKNA